MKVTLLPLVACALMAAISTGFSSDKVSRITPTDYIGKTLLDIGTISKIKIDQIDSDAPLKSSSDLIMVSFDVLSKSRIADFRSVSVTELPPKFEITYTDGTIVKASRLIATVHTPGRQPFYCILLQKNTAEQGAAANP